MEDGAAKERRLPSVKGRGCCRLWWRRRWLDPVALLDSPLLLHCSFFFPLSVFVSFSLLLFSSFLLLLLSVFPLVSSFSLFLCFLFFLSVPCFFLLFYALFFFLSFSLLPYFFLFFLFPFFLSSPLSPFSPVFIGNIGEKRRPTTPAQSMARG